MYDKETGSLWYPGDKGLLGIQGVNFQRWFPEIGSERDVWQHWKKDHPRTKLIQQTHTRARAVCCAAVRAGCGREQCLESEMLRSKQLPKRVLSAIRFQDEESEYLISWIQLTVVGFFSILYAVSPKAFADRQTFSLVPWFLAVYLVLTCIRVMVARHHRLSAILLYGSILADIGLLLAMIFAFHLQYRQPPSFYLKAPTLLYVFIFIALRALRFEARFVIAAGISALQGYRANQPGDRLVGRIVEGVEDPLDLVVLAS